MITSKNIKKLIFEHEKFAILASIILVIFFMVLIGVGGFLDDTNESMMQMIAELGPYMIRVILFLYAIMYILLIVLYCLPQASNMNCPKKLLSKVMFYQIIKRSIILSIIYMGSIYFSNNSYFLGFKISTLNSEEVITLFIAMILVINFVFNFYFSLDNISNTYNKQIALTYMLIVVSIAFLSAKQLIILAYFGAGIYKFIFIMLIVDILLCILNYKLTKISEYKF
ncbi:hypothetical protein PV797_15415 [Clostridiaceae bacterium M8S5]|nr:hypothetical protein PV797_15415 [Clostridiaceae bacterium M8S5]